MKKLMLLLLTAPLLFSCVNKKEKDLESMTLQAKTKLNDNAFKENGKISFQEFRLVKCDTLNEHFLLNGKIQNCFKKSRFFLGEAERYGKLKRLNAQQAALYKDLAYSTLYNIEKQDFEENSKKFKHNIDSSSFYNDEVVKLEKLIKQMTAPKTVYHCSFYVKAIFTKDNKNENFLDTLRVNYNDVNKMIYN